MKNRISFCVNACKKSTFRFIGGLQNVLRFLRIYNNVLPSPSFHPPFQTYVLQHPYQSAIYEIVSKKFRKKDRYVWSE